MLKDSTKDPEADLTTYRRIPATTRHMGPLPILNPEILKYAQSPRPNSEQPLIEQRRFGLQSGLGLVKQGMPYLGASTSQLPSAMSNLRRKGLQRNPSAAFQVQSLPRVACVHSQARHKVPKKACHEATCAKCELKVL